MTYHIRQEVGLSLIRSYILEKKGVDVGQINPPRNVIEMQMYSIAVDRAHDYFLVKNETKVEESRKGNE